MIDSAIAIIPARYGSTRLPGKPLKEINGKPMIYWVWNEVKKVLPTYVATDDDKILKAIQSEGGDAILTSKSCLNGTQRVAEALKKLDIYPEVILNIQGDEPLVRKDDIRNLISLMDNEIIEIGTLVTSASLSDLKSINNCFVDRTDMGICQEFSRDPKSFTQKPYRHVGMYGFRSDVLFKLVELEPTIREKKEKLEQLRWLENGYTIHSSIINAPGLGVDTDEDLKFIKRIMEK